MKGGGEDQELWLYADVALDEGDPSHYYEGDPYPSVVGFEAYELRWKDHEYRWEDDYDYAIQEPWEATLVL
jgi:hypothetical protein